MPRTENKPSAIRHIPMWYGNHLVIERDGRTLITPRYPSLDAVYEAAAAMEGMTPGAYRKALLARTLASVGGR